MVFLYTPYSRQRISSETRHQSDTEQSQGREDRNPESAHAIHPPETEMRLDTEYS